MPATDDWETPLGVWATADADVQEDDDRGREAHG
jgi:hypothetical protein